MCLYRTGSQPAKWPISGYLLQSLAGMESPLMGVLGAGGPFFWLSGKTRSEEGPFGLPLSSELLLLQEVLS